MVVNSIFEIIHTNKIMLLKRIFLAFTFFSIFSNCFSQELPNPDELIDISKSTGLVSYLTHVQHYAPYALNYAHKKLTDEKAKNEIYKNYTYLSITFNSLINQLIIDMNLRNSLSYYKKLDVYVRENEKNEKIKNYYKLMDALEKYFMKLYYINDNSSKASIIGPDQAITFIGGVPYTLYKDVKANNSVKVTAISTLLKELRLLSLNEALPKNKK